MPKLMNRLSTAVLALKGAVTFDHNHLFMTGQPLGGRSAAQPTHGAYSNSWVAFSCIKRLATDASGIPLRVLRDPTKPDSVVPDSHPLAKMIRSPSPHFSQTEFVQWLVTWLNLRGEFFVTFNDFLRPTEFVFWYDPRGWREVMKDGRVLGWEYKQGSYRLQAAAINVLHHRYVNPSNPWRGQAPIEAAAIPYSIDVATGVLQNDIVSRGGERAPIFTANPDMTVPQRNAAVDVLRGRNASQDGSQPRPVLLPAGISVVDPKFITADLSILDKQESQPDRICAVFGMSKSLLGFEDIDKYATFQGRLKVYFTQTLVPMLHGMEGTFDAFFNTSMPSDYRGYVRFDLDAVEALAESVAEKFAAAVVAHNGGLPWTVCNERFGLGLDLDMVPGADRVMVSSTLAPIDAILAEWDAPSKPEDAPAAPQAAVPAAPAAMPATGGAPASGPTGEPVANTALNGAQVTSMIEVAIAVADGSLPLETAVAILVRAFQMTPAEATALLRPAADMPKPEDDPEPAPPPAVDAPKDDAKRAGSIMAAARIKPSEKQRVLIERAINTRDRMQRQQRLFRAESKMRREWKGIVGTAMKRTLAALRDADTEASARSAVEAGMSDFNDKALAVAAKYHDIAVREGMRSIEEIVNGKMDDATLHTWKATAPWRPEVADAIKARKKHIDKMSKSLFADILAAAVESVSSGMSYTDVANIVVERFKLGSGGFNRAITIARTEVGSAYSVARFTEMKANKFNAHMWLTSDDELVRGSDGKGDYDHAKCHEEVVDLGDQFSCELTYPMEDGGDPGNVINCRCETVPVERDE